MRLILNAISYKGLPVIKPIKAEFTQAGGSIGRKADRTMVLDDPDKIVSGQHAEIHYANGQFLIRDTSSNGTYLVNARQNLSHAQSVLQSNEILRIGEYEISIEILADLSNGQLIDRSAGSGRAGPFSDNPPDFSSANIGGQAFPTGNQDVIGQENLLEITADRGLFQGRPFSGDLNDDLNAISGDVSANSVKPAILPASPVDPGSIADFLSGINAQATFNTTPESSFDSPFNAGGPFSGSLPTSTSSSESQLNAAPVIRDSFTPPVVKEDKSDLSGSISQYFAGLETLPVLENPGIEQALPEPAEQSLAVGNAQSYAVETKQTERGTPQAGNATLIHEFLSGAGISDESFLSPEQWAETMKSTGALFRLMVENLMEILRARAEMKSQFRVSVTTLRTVDNNPLKFNPDVESVIKMLLGPHNPAFIPSEQAVSGAYRDIKSHQIAITAGIQAALAEVLSRFDPQGFESKFAEGLVFQKKTKCWELYCERYPQLKSLAIEEFFGEAFADAYEKQMQFFADR